MKGKTGSIYEYFYLWDREFQKGEETGRKARTSMMVVTVSGDTAVMLAISSKPPRNPNGWMLIPEIEARRANLYTPAWLTIDEYNLASLSNLYDFDGIEPLGAFSAAYTRTVIETFQAFANSVRKPKVVRRT